MFGFSPFASTPFADLSASSAGIAFVAGTEGMAELGVVTTQAKADVLPTTVYAVGQTGLLSMIGEANVLPIGALGTTELGIIDVIAPAVIDLSGVYGTNQVGTVSIIQGSGVTVNPTGVQATGYTGNETVVAKARVTLIGVSASITVNSVLVWGNIPDGQNPNWTEVIT
jgi:hypothetical protein